MRQQIIKQPSGKFAVWSTISGSFIVYDCDKLDIIEMEMKEFGNEGIKSVLRILDKIEKGIPAYFQFSLTWEEACAYMAVQNPDEIEELKGLPLDEIDKKHLYNPNSEYSKKFKQLLREREDD